MSQTTAFSIGTRSEGEQDVSEEIGAAEGQGKEADDGVSSEERVDAHRVFARSNTHQERLEVVLDQGANQRLEY